MCGIVAVVTAFSNGFSTAESEVFRDLLFMDTLRGVDSTGVFGADKYGNVQIHKEATSAPWFISSPEYREFSSNLVRNGLFAVGHNRAATRGTINDKNAHPFSVDDKIVLVQNGTFYGDHKHIHDTEVDTEALAHLVAREPDIEKALKQVNAAYALMWYDVEKKELNVIRNNDRPLYVCYTKMGGIIFASEGEMILAAAARRKLELKDKPYQMKEHCLYTISFKEGGGWVAESKDLDCEYKHSHPFSRSRSYHGHFAGYEPCYDEYDEYYGHHHQGRTPAWEIGTPPKQTKIVEDSDNLEVSCIEALLKKGEKPFTHQQMHDMEQVLTTGKDIVVEPFDYIHGNEHKDCSVFHIVCYPVTPTPLTNPPIFYWTVYGKTELEALRLASGDDLYTARIGPKLDRVVVGEDNIKRYAVCYCAMEPKLIEEIVNGPQ